MSNEIDFTSLDDPYHLDPERGVVLDSPDDEKEE